ncbi:hypothetical protein B0H66DRAFT_237956 [Apodospora peruviana]|uniref:Uncharacterized protein n=1 Tax=Apodospora peruviana TaxID=516989 RepID=A0AAE0I4H5_9PEZI|nr:hypothetical protein B0H66DRAFT_237956 [Apodospora peruviana]
MGLLSFLTRKSHDKVGNGKANGLLRSRKYSSTTAGALPILGTLPVTGNGPNVLEALTRPRPDLHLTQTQLSLDGGRVAPSPVVSQFREESVERPNTAPNKANISSAWPLSGNKLRSTPRGAPPVSFRIQKAAVATNDGRPVSQGTRETATGFSPSLSGPLRSSSMHSDNGGRGFKDILDAQSEIKPADFKMRVKAAGARDYGEDVAERNMGENGFNLEAPQVQAFYAQSAAASRLRRQDNVQSQSDLRSTWYRTGLRTKSLNSSTQYPLLSRTAAQFSHIRGLLPPEGTPYFAQSSMSPSDNTTVKRRQSVTSYLPDDALSNRERTYSMDRFLSLHPLAKSTNNILQPVPVPELEGMARHRKTPCPSTVGPIVRNFPLASTQQRADPKLISRDSVVLAKHRTKSCLTDYVLDDDDDDDNVRPHTSHHSMSGERSFSLGYRGSVVLPPRKRHSLHTLHPSSVASRETTLSLAYAPVDQPPRPKSSRHREQDKMVLTGSTTTLALTEDAAVSPTVITGSVPSLYPGVTAATTPFTIPSVGGGIIKTQQKQLSVTSIQTTNLDGISEYSPVRGGGTRSLRAWSASSATATASDTSSNPFQRPHSRHTVNTSVNLSNAASASSLKPVSSSPPSSPLNSPTAATAVSPRTPKSSQFNIDDYVSSDDDSLMAPTRNRAGEDEEDLLFRDTGYGLDGSQLPGLFDSLTSASRQQQSSLLARPRSSPLFSSPIGARSMVYAGESFGRAAGRRFVLDTAADDDSDSSGPGGGDDADSLFSGSSSVRTRSLHQLQRSPRRATKTLSAIHHSNHGHAAALRRPRSTNSGYQLCYSAAGGRAPPADEVIEEEREGKVDVAAAVRLRKEVKAQKRAAKGKQQQQQPEKQFVVPKRRERSASAAASSSKQVSKVISSDDGATGGLGLHVGGEEDADADVEEGNHADVACLSY